MKKKTAQRKIVVRKKKSRTPLLFYILIFSVLFTTGLFVQSNFVANSQQAVKGAASADEIIVKYKNSVSEEERQVHRKALKTKLKHRNPKIGFEVVKIEEGTLTEKISQYKNNPKVEYAEPNFKATTFVITNDTSLSKQWGLFKINSANQSAISAWDVTSGNAQIKVAILDTGIEETHPDLSGKVIGSANFTDSPTVQDQDGHGTHVAGITAAGTNNGDGVAGSGYNTVLLNGKVLGDDGSGYYSWIANGIVWAADQGAQVINLSLGGPSSSLALQDAINYAWNKGAVIVAAAGNSNTTSPNYPGYYQNVIAVAATDSNDARASFSNYGNWVDVAAPGVSIYSTYKGNTYAYLSGTSMATPMTSGTTALIWASNICTTNTCVRDQLEKTADQITGTGTYWTYGRINAHKAVSVIEPTATKTPTPTNTPIPTSTPTPAQVTLPRMTVSNIETSYSIVSGGYRRVTSTVTVINESTLSPLSNATVNATITSPSGKNFVFSGRTNTRGKYSFNVRLLEKGTYITTVTNVQRTGYSYHPTITNKTLLVQ